MCQVNGKAKISTPHSSHIFQPILMKLKTTKDIRDTTQHAKFGWCGTTGREGGMRGESILFYARQQNASRVLAIVWASVRLSVCLSVCHTRELYQNGAS